MRTLLDANLALWTLLPSDNPKRAVAVILPAAYAGHFSLPAADEFLDEVMHNAPSKPALARLISSASLRDALATFSRRRIRLPRLLPPLPAICRDRPFDYLVAYAESDLAGFPVTYDEDLLIFDGQFPFRISSPPEFLAVFRDRGLL